MRTLLVLLLAAWCGLCFADDRVERRAVANKLVELMGMAEAGIKPAAECLPKEEELSALARSVYEKHPDTLGGITPQSAYWQDFERIYTVYSLQSCLYLIPDVLASAYASALAEKVPLPELQAAVQFYASPEGQRFAKAALLAGEKYCAELKQAEAAMSARAQASYRIGLRQLIERYKANPK